MLDNIFGKDFLANNVRGKVSEYFNYTVDLLPKIILSALVFYIGLKIINYIHSIVTKHIVKLKLDAEIESFVKGLINILLKILLFFVIAGIIGIETAKFVAVLGAAVFAIGMGLQGSLGHFAAGLLILIFKPFKVGDVVQVQDNLGTIKNINLINTEVLLFDHNTSIIPNGLAISDVVTNFSKENILRVDTPVHMAYKEDFNKVEKILLEKLSNIPNVLQDPKTFVGIDSYESHTIALMIWTYTNTEHYWQVYFDVRKAVKQAFHENNIQMAYSEGIELGNIGP